MIKKGISILLLCLSFSFGYAQKGTNTFGLQYKPILPLKILNVTDLELSEDNFNVKINYSVSESLGLSIPKEEDLKNSILIDWIE